MNTRRLGGWALAGFLAVAGCGSGDDSSMMGPCWPLPSTPGGSVVLGTGDLYYEPMPDVLLIQRTLSQSDPFMFVHARMTGMPPGDPENPFDPVNPHTKVAMAVEALDMTFGVDCPASLGYVESTEPGFYDLPHSLRIGFGSFPLENLDGKQATISVEIVGSNKLYAINQKVVTLTVPQQDSFDAGVD